MGGVCYCGTVNESREDEASVMGDAKPQWGVGSVYRGPPFKLGSHTRSAITEKLGTVPEGLLEVLEEITEEFVAYAAYKGQEPTVAEVVAELDYLFATSSDLVEKLQFRRGLSGRARQAITTAVVLRKMPSGVVRNCHQAL